MGSYASSLRRALATARASPGTTFADSRAKRRAARCRGTLGCVSARVVVASTLCERAPGELISVHEKHRLLLLRPGNGAGMRLHKNRRQHGRRIFRLLGSDVAGISDSRSEYVRGIRRSGGAEHRLLTVRSGIRGSRRPNALWSSGSTIARGPFSVFAREPTRSDTCVGAIEHTQATCRRHEPSTGEQR